MLKRKVCKSTHFFPDTISNVLQLRRGYGDAERGDAGMEEEGRNQNVLSQTEGLKKSIKRQC